MLELCGLDAALNFTLVIHTQVETLLPARRVVLASLAMMARGVVSMVIAGGTALVIAAKKRAQGV